MFDDLLGRLKKIRKSDFCQALSKPFTAAQNNESRDQPAPADDATDTDIVNEDGVASHDTKVSSTVVDAGSTDSTAAAASGPVMPAPQEALPPEVPVVDQPTRVELPAAPEPVVEDAPLEQPLPEQPAAEEPATVTAEKAVETHSPSALLTDTSGQITSYDAAVNSLRRTIDKVLVCSDEERERLNDDLNDLNDMVAKMNSGRVDIVVFGEISTGKSALINALIGEDVAKVDVQGGWTKDIWRHDWQECSYVAPGFANSKVVVIDTPGINEVGGAGRGDIATEVARRADIILFVTDSDLNETEFTALTALASLHKPLILVINKIDLYSRKERERLLTILRDERLAGVIPAESIVETAADPREKEYIVTLPDGTEREEWRTPPKNVGDLKTRIVEVLEGEGLALMALNAAMYASDTTDRIAALRVKLRETKAKQTIWSYAAIKAVAVALNPMPIVDVVGGSAVDATMVLTLAHIYGLEMTWSHARGLVSSILQAAGWVMLGELMTHIGSSMFKASTLGWGAALTALPQGAAAGYGSYIVGQAAKYYFEHGASWGGEAPKAVVARILEETDKESVLEHLKEEIKKKISVNRHSGTSSK